MKATIEHLPKAHRDTLEFLVFHLARVMQNQGENLMGAGNLAVVFAPTVLIPRELAQEMQDVEKSRSAVEFMLENYKELFDTEA
jgi:Rho-type GTPase-activating protein 1/2